MKAILPVLLLIATINSSIAQHEEINFEYGGGRGVYYKNDYYFSGSGGIHKMDKATERPVLVTNHGAFEMQALAGYIYFTEVLMNGELVKLWRTDGTEQGTVLLKEFNTYFRKMGRMAGTENKVYIMADLNELWETDGTAAGTIKVADYDYDQYHAPFLFATNTTLFIYDYVKKKLFRLNPTSNAIEVIRDPFTPDGLLRVFNGKLMVNINDAEGQGLYHVQDNGSFAKIAKTSTHNNEGVFTSFFPLRSTEGDGKLYFSAYQSEELWVTDGTGSGTRLITMGYDLNNLTYSKNRLFYFSTNSAGSVNMLDPATGDIIGSHSNESYVYSACAYEGSLYFAENEGRFSVMHSDGTVKHFDNPALAKDPTYDELQGHSVYYTFITGGLTEIHGNIYYYVSRVEDHRYPEQYYSSSSWNYRMEHVPGEGVIQSLNKRNEMISLEAYPNPFTDKIQVSVPEKGTVTVTITDLSGKMYYREVTEAAEGVVSVDASEIENKGVYLLLVNGATYQASAKLLRQ